MKYNKPEVVVLGNAAELVKAVSKPNCFHDTVEASTCGAYEADE